MLFFFYKSQCQLCFYLAVGWIKIDSEVMTPSEEEPGMAWGEGVSEVRLGGLGQKARMMGTGSVLGFCPRTMLGQGDLLTPPCLVISPACCWERQEALWWMHQSSSWHPRDADGAVAQQIPGDRLFAKPRHLELEAHWKARVAAGKGSQGVVLLLSPGPYCCSLLS